MSIHTIPTSLVVVVRDGVIVLSAEDATRGWSDEYPLTAEAARELARQLEDAALELETGAK
jgi:hypothetical protein